MITTDRLILRKHTLADADSVFQLATDPTVLQFIRGLPVSPEEAWHRLLRYAGHWSLLGYGMFAVVERASNQFIGEVGLADFHRGLGEDFDGVPEAAWVFAGSSHGKGFASEAMGAALGWFDAQRLSSRAVCIVDPGNVASIKVANKLGFNHYGQGQYRGKNINKYERLRPGS
nr:GNAT family N-acetyltransferase [uncultured Massilia sp.]